MDKNTELKNSILIFLDETIGFRKSLHHLHRWYETGLDQDLINLVIEIGREHFINVWPLVDYCSKVKDATPSLVNMLSTIKLHVPCEWTDDKIVTLSPPPPWVFQGFVGLGNNIEQHATNFWNLNQWRLDNSAFDNPVAMIPELLNRIIAAKDDKFKLIRVMELLVGRDTIFSCILDTSMNAFAEQVSKYYPDHKTTIKNLTNTIESNPDLNWKDALSRNQISSKFWLMEKMEELEILSLLKPASLFDNADISIIVVGGWVGILPALMEMKELFGKNVNSKPHIINIDLDDSVHPAAINLLKDVASFKYSGIARDIKKYNFTQHKNLLVIDTIVEHFKDHGKWVSTLPKGTKVILQGNNMFDVPDHVNCHNTLEEFLEDCGLNTILWSGELMLHKCLRFMAIGVV